MNTFLIVYENANFTTTDMNATLQEVKEYYVGNYFTFGTCEENEEQLKAVAVFEYDTFKEKVLNYNMNNNNITLNFDDEKQEITFKTQYNDMVKVTYEHIEMSMYKFEKSTYSEYVNVMAKVSHEMDHVFENELYLHGAYQDSIMAYSKDFREQETSEPYHIWLENHLSYAIIEGY